MEVVIFIGLQASGKTTYYRRTFASTHVHISKDLMRNNRKPGRRQLTLLKEALQRGQNTVVDNTNPGAAERAPVIELAKIFGARIIGYYFHSALQECRRSNEQRSGKERVPDVALFTTVKRLECPDAREGFEELYYVRWSGTGGFVVVPWSPDAAPEGIASGD